MIDIRKLAFCSALALAGAAHAQDKVNLVLNWLPGADHAPLFYAQRMGWFDQAGVRVTLENGKGSTYSLQKVASGESALGIADMPTAMQGKGKGMDVIGIYAIYAQSPYGIYWRRSSGIREVKDLKGKKLGNPPGDAARIMWPAIAKAVGLGADDITWVNVAPEGKIAALQSGAIQGTTHFYSVHYVYERLLGSDMGFVATRDLGFNPYGNALIVNRAFLDKNRPAVEKVVHVVQRAFAVCMQNPQPCNEHLAEVASQKVEDVAAGWSNVTTLLVDDASKKVALGAFDASRVQKDYDVVKSLFEIKDFDPKSIFTNDLLDKQIRAK